LAVLKFTVFFNKTGNSHSTDTSGIIDYGDNIVTIFFNCHKVEEITARKADAVALAEHLADWGDWRWNY
jgi:hypothetical protein